MMNKKKKALMGIIIGMNMILMAACGSAKSEMPQTSATEQAMVENKMDSTTSAASMSDTATTTDAATTESAKMSGTQEIGNTTSNVVAGQKLIKDVTLSVETKTFDDFISELNSQINGIGGYVQNSDVSGGTAQDNNNRYGTIVARIPADKLNGFIQLVKEKGNVVHTSEMTTDITLQYVDMESHIKALKVEQETLLGLLEKAEKIEDVIAIQGQLTQVRYELESYESQIKMYDNLVQYSTVTISISEVERETNTEKPSFLNEIKAKLGDNLYDIKNGARSLVINLIAALPYLVILGVIITVCVVVVRKMKLKRKNKSLNEKVNEKDKKETKESE